MKFYLAAGYDQQDAAHKVAAVISRMSGCTCTSRWLTTIEEDATEQVLARSAKMDYEDVVAADALVVLQGQSTTGAMWWECGMALGMGKLVMHVKDWSYGSEVVPPEGFMDVPQPIFTLLPQVRRYSNLAFLCAGMREYSFVVNGGKYTPAVRHAKEKYPLT